MKQFLVFSLFLGFLVACDSCKNEQVPAVYLSLHLQRPALYSMFNENGRFIGAPNAITKLPFTLSSDTTTYFFQNRRGRVVDTLSISYTREASFEDTGCGFFLLVQDIRILPATTFDSVAIFHPEPFLPVEINVYD